MIGTHKQKFSFDFSSIAILNLDALSLKIIEIAQPSAESVDRSETPKSRDRHLLDNLPVGLPFAAAPSARRNEARAKATSQKTMIGFLAIRSSVYCGSLPVVQNLFPCPLFT